jgi:hypothetical protein
VGWLRGFIKGCAEITRVLYESFEHENEWEWIDGMERAFLDTRKVLSEAEKLRVPEFDKRFALRTDRSKTGTRNSTTPRG